MTFAGFGAETVAFLEELGENNTKTWFDANRTRYDEHYIGPAKAFVEAAGTRLERVAPAVQAVPKVNGSIFRINRDIRFSKDKTPYKDHLDLWFWEGERKTAVSGFFLRIAADSVGIGVGAHGFKNEQLTAYRDAVVDEAAGADLQTVVNTVGAAGLEVKSTHYKRVPNGYSGDEFQETMLRHNALWTSVEVAHPDAMGGPEFVDWCVETWLPMEPVHRWLVDRVV